MLATRYTVPGKQTGLLLLIICGFCYGFLNRPPFRYAAGSNGKEQLMGEKNSGTKADASEATASPDGEHIAWRDKRGSKWIVVLDGKPQGLEFDEVKQL